MQTRCNQQSFEFHPLNERQAVGRFDGGAITTDAGRLLLREVEKRTRIIEHFAGCFRDHRAVGHVEHTVRELVAQRVYGLALGYEDLNDHELLRQHLPIRLESTNAMDPAQTFTAFLITVVAGAPGIILSQKYSEVRLENLSGAGAALKELGIRT